MWAWISGGWMLFVVLLVVLAVGVGTGSGSSSVDRSGPCGGDEAGRCRGSQTITMP